jgi:hypothetical protein
MNSFELHGAADCISNGILWEFKCTSELKREHFIQLAMYAYLWQKNNPDNPLKYRLYNILTNEMWEIKIFNTFEPMINKLFEKKYNLIEKVSDTENYNNVSNYKKSVCLL